MLTIVEMDCRPFILMPVNDWNKFDFNYFELQETSIKFNTVKRSRALLTFWEPSYQMMSSQRYGTCRYHGG